MAPDAGWGFLSTPPAANPFFLLYFKNGRPVCFCTGTWFYWSRVSTLHPLPSGRDCVSNWLAPSSAASPDFAQLGKEHFSDGLLFMWICEVAKMLPWWYKTTCISCVLMAIKQLGRFETWELSQSSALRCKCLWCLGFQWEKTEDLWEFWQSWTETTLKGWTRVHIGLWLRAQYVSLVLWLLSLSWWLTELWALWWKADWLSVITP